VWTLNGLDVEEIAMAVVDQTDYDHQQVDRALSGLASAARVRPAPRKGIQEIAR
jgi:hypothetical protein